MDTDEIAEMMSTPPGGENHGRRKTQGGWRSLEPWHGELTYVVPDPLYRKTIPRSQHGSRSRYVRGCRCRLCKTANRDYMRMRRRGGYGVTPQ